MKFEDVFWGTSADPLLGIRTLHDGFQTGLSELKDLHAFLCDRYRAEDAYATRLSDIAKQKGALPDSSSGLLSQIYRSLKQETYSLSRSHRAFAGSLASLASSLADFLRDNERLSNSRTLLIDESAKDFESKKSSLEEVSKEAEAAWKSVLDQNISADGEGGDSDALEEGLMEVVEAEGGVVMTRNEVKAIVEGLKKDVKVQDHKTLLTTHKSCIPSTSLLAHLRPRLNSSAGDIDDAALRAFADSLVAKGFLSPVSPSSHSPGTFDRGQLYRWSEPTPLGGAAMSGGTAGANRERALKVETEARRLARAAEDARGLLEAQCVEYIHALEAAHTARLALAAETLTSFLVAARTNARDAAVAVDRVALFVETFKPEREIRIVAERDRTGNARVPVVVYFPMGGDRVAAAEEVCFGVGVEELVAFEGRRVPELLARGLEAVTSTCAAATAVSSTGSGGAKPPTSELDLWLDSNMHMPRVRALRQELNRNGWARELVRLKSQPPAVIVGLLKLWLVQLPISLCSHEIYEPLKILYLSKSDEFASTRLTSLKSLLSTLSKPHYDSLVTLATYWHNLVAGLERDDTKVAELAATLGTLVLRPRVETQVTAHDRHPARFLRDLLTHHAEIFGVNAVTATRFGPNEDDDEDDTGSGVLDVGWNAGSSASEAVVGEDSLVSAAELRKVVEDEQKGAVDDAVNLDEVDEILAAARSKDGVPDFLS
ncbi:hypothetical protein DFJ73DRAFT_151247 [Zopfochytrium polystomum]|nr:hypothetical protein DFJ73DRAFT_151247 [Zopfochytrium polystomum]